MTRVERIGDATLYLGDCRDILPTLGKVDAVVTDPPYGMSFRSNHRANKHKAITNDDNAELLMWTCNIHASHSKYIFGRWDNLTDIPKPKSKIAWVKNNWSMGDLEHEHARQTEEIFFYPGPEHTFPKYRPSDVIEAPRTGNNHHPSEKPVQLMMAIIEWTSGIVLDPFMGSGSTGVAASRLGRPFIGIDVDEEHFETACKRISEVRRHPDMFAVVAAARSSVVTGDMFA